MPYTLHLTPYTLHPTPYTLHPTPYTLHPTEDDEEGGEVFEEFEAVPEVERPPHHHRHLRVIHQVSLRVIHEVLTAFTLNLKRFNAFYLKKTRPESGLDCLVCAIFGIRGV